MPTRLIGLGVIACRRRGMLGWRDRLALLVCLGAWGGMTDRGESVHVVTSRARGELNTTHVLQAKLSYVRGRSSEDVVVRDLTEDIDVKVQPQFWLDIPGNSPRSLGDHNTGSEHLPGRKQISFGLGYARSKIPVQGSETIFHCWILTDLILQKPRGKFFLFPPDLSGHGIVVADLLSPIPGRLERDDTQIDCWSFSTVADRNLNAFVREAFMSVICCFRSANCCKLRKSNPSPLIQSGRFDAGIQCSFALRLTGGHGLLGLSRRGIHTTGEPVHVSDGLPCLVGCYASATPHLFQRPLHDLQLTAVDGQSPYTNSDQTYVGRSKDILKPSYFSHIVSWVCTAGGFITGVCGLLSFGRCGSDRFRWKYIIVGCILWLISFLLVVHGASLTLGLPSAYALAHSDSRPVAIALHYSSAKISRPLYPPSAMPGGRVVGCGNAFGIVCLDGSNMSTPPSGSWSPSGVAL